VIRIGKHMLAHFDTRHKETGSKFLWASLCVQDGDPQRLYPAALIYGGAYWPADMLKRAEPAHIRTRILSRAYIRRRILSCLYAQPLIYGRILSAYAHTEPPMHTERLCTYWAAYAYWAPMHILSAYVLKPLIYRGACRGGYMPSRLYAEAHTEPPIYGAAYVPSRFSTAQYVCGLQ